MNYDLVELLDVSVRSYSNQIVVLAVTMSRPGLTRPAAHGCVFAGDDRLEEAVDLAGRVLTGWAAVGELAVAQLVDGWPLLAP